MDVESGVFDGRYRLVRPIAKVTSGGYVYASDHAHTRKACAIKILDPDVGERTRKRTWREMEALAHVQGPGVVEFRDGGESDGRLYIVLELLEGRTLAGLLLAKGRLGVEQTAAIGVGVATVLSRCHERGVIHRDIKPANIFVTAQENVQLLDFGVAKLVDGERQLEKITQANSLVGTPEYMPWEALLSSPDVDERADQYALGVTLYECLTGVVPFEGTYGEVVKKISTTTLPAITDVRPDVPRTLADVVARALRRDPGERFESILEMRDAIRASVEAQGDAGIFDLRAPNRAARNAPTAADSPAAKVKAGGPRRRHARAPYVTLAHIDCQDGSHADGRIEEISESGVQFVGKRAFVEGEPVSVRFALPVTGRIAAVTATCRWARATRGSTAAGFELSNLSSDAIGEIRKYVSLMCAD